MFIKKKDNKILSLREKFLDDLNKELEMEKFKCNGKNKVTCGICTNVTTEVIRDECSNCRRVVKL